MLKVNMLCINFEIINVVTEPDHNEYSLGIYRKTATRCCDDVTSRHTRPR